MLTTTDRQITANAFLEATQPSTIGLIWSNKAGIGDKSHDWNSIAVKHPLFLQFPSLEGEMIGRENWAQSGDITLQLL